MISAGNLAGLPALTVPNGLADEGLPSSIAFLGGAFGEAKLLQIGKRLQQRSEHHLRHPRLIDAPPAA
jgi:aspartyl-tRNA(Asn)/glutamyl-tRNA(Gln) amidotransferase subunit A